MRGAVLPPILNSWVYMRSMMCVAAFATSHAGAADDRKEPPTQPGYLSLHRLDAYLEIKADYRYNRVDSDARRRFERDRSQTNREWSFEERVGLTLEGTVLDPGFITFGGELSFAPTQSRFDEFGGLVRQPRHRSFVFVNQRFSEFRNQINDIDAR